MRKVIGALCLLTASICAEAGTCEESFQTIGDARNGLLFTGQVRLCVPQARWASSSNWHSTAAMRSAVS